MSELSETAEVSEAPEASEAPGSIAAVDPDAVAIARDATAEADRVIVKTGANSPTDEDSNLDDDKLDKLVDDIESPLSRGKEVLLASSGAAGAGIGWLDHPTADRDTLEASQALLTVGQSLFTYRYTESFERYDRRVAQILITQHDLENPERFTNFRSTVETLLEWGVVPIINENDAVATEELQIGDNDMIPSDIAVGIGVDLLVTLTDVGGVYTGNPKEDSDAEHIEVVGDNHNDVEDIVTANPTGGFDGIQTKVRGARDAAEYGISAVIVWLTESDALAKIAEREPVGTIFLLPDGELDDWARYDRADRTDTIGGAPPRQR